MSLLRTLLERLFIIATTGRPGPVIIDIPKDLTDPNIKIDFEYKKNIKIRSYKVKTNENQDKIEEAAKIICKAKKPMIYTGGGVILSKASNELIKLTKLLNYPITNTLMGLGAFPSSDNQFLGMLGMHGTYEANMAMHDCDVLLAVGARFDDRVTGDTKQFCPKAKIIHIDIDPSSISKIIEVDHSLIGDTKKILKQLITCIEKYKRNIDKIAIDKWWKKIKSWQKKNCLSYKNLRKLLSHSL